MYLCVCPSVCVSVRSVCVRIHVFSVSVCVYILVNLCVYVSVLSACLHV